ncbi:MAG: hypothetical protein ACRDRX_28330 [Pseudonocardiaceae bacterium]
MNVYLACPGGLGSRAASMGPDGVPVGSADAADRDPVRPSAEGAGSGAAGGQ